MSKEKSNPKGNGKSNNGNSGRINESTVHYSNIGDRIEKGEKGQYAKPVINDVVKPPTPKNNNTGSKKK